MKLPKFGVVALVLICGLFAVSAEARADSLSPTSYDMANGGNEGYGYFDETYTGSGSTTTGYALLSGGLGDLTDGVIPTVSWNYVETAAATPEPYVGWMDRGVTITFNFSSTVSIDSVTVHADHASYGEVYLPPSVTVAMGGTSSTFAVSDPSTYGPQALTLTNLGMTGTSLTLTVANRFSSGSKWIMLSEVEFDGSAAAVPEPTALALLSLGVGGLLLARRRKRRAA